MVIQHNLLASNASRMYGINHVDLSKSAEKLSSGYRVNRSADDAAGLAISEVMRRQIRGLTQASINAQDGISMVQAAEGSLHEVHDMLHRINELCVKAANDTMTSEDRAYVQDEIAENIREIDRVSDLATFNDIKMLGGDENDPTASKSFKLQVGTEKDQYVTFSMDPVNATSLGVKDIDVKTEGGAGDAIQSVEEAIRKLSKERSNLGSVQNRLEHTIRNLDNVDENTTSAESKIRDTDMSKELVSHSLKSMLENVGFSMMANSNQSNQNVLAMLS